MLLKVALWGDVAIMVDSPSDQMSLVRFRARPFHTILHHRSAS